MAKILVNIADNSYIPSLGKGPFVNKFIHEELFRNLKRLGYLIEEVKEPTVELMDLQKDEVEETKEEVKEPEVEVDEEPTEAEEVQKEEVEEKEEPVEHAFTDDELNFLEKKAKKDEIIEAFTEHGIQFDEEATIKELLAIIGLER